MNRLKRQLKNLIFPAIIFGVITGVCTALVVVLYKFMAKHVISFSLSAYSFLRNNLYYIPLVVIAFYGVALLFSRIYKKQPRVRGGEFHRLSHYFET